VGEAPLERQPLVVDLCRPENLPGPPARIEFLSTHGSLVFRTGTDVYKLKRPRDYGFFDYTTLPARRHFCDEELRLNRRTAPDVYLDVLPVFRDARGHSLVRPGEIVDWAVHMRQLPDEASALSLLRAGRLGAAEIEAFAARLARFYAQAAPAPADPAGLVRSVEENFTQCRAFVPRLLDGPTLEAVERGQRAWLAAHSARLAARPARDGHGDLRLEHVYLLEQGPVIIDCIEFADRYRLGDPALDAAFLAMDLERCGHGALAELLLARLAYESDDYDAYPLLDGYESYRATVRCKVAGLVATDAATAPAAAARKAGEARAFLELARTLVERDGAGPRPRAVVAVGGTIGSGKTTLAEALARRAGLPQVSADATRKHLAGLRHDECAGLEHYAPAFTAATQDELLRRAEQPLLAGRSAIVDTTFAHAALRARARALARRHGTGFLLVECRVPEALARQRLRARTGGVSDAREDLLAASRASWEPVGGLASGEHLVVDTSGAVERGVDAVLQALGWPR
jgi:aminoglycoside phosphotransferase family enzyme/predicted kinase